MHDENTTPPAIETLLREQPLLWRGRPAQGPARGRPTGFAALDAALPDGGWPAQGLVEVRHEGPGLGQVSLFLPLAERLAGDGLGLVWLNPPPAPYAPALVAAGLPLARCLQLRPASHRDQLWAAERTLRSAACGLLLWWPPVLAPTTVRRLQLAAGEGRTLAALFVRRPLGGAHVALRLGVQRHANGERTVRILKARGSHRRPDVRLPA